ncbi:hypothetical protein [Microbacterium sp.]|uniref:hypothetical protein n=1 Tax=Microbacterium sp. TaxID=51671 RepID=UPI003A887A13
MTTISFRPRLAAAALVLTAVVVAPAAALAEDGEDEAGPQTWAVAPADADGPDGRGALEYIVEPHDVYSDHVAVRNLSEQPLTVDLYGQDAVQTTENSFEVLTPDDDGKRVGAWLELPVTEVTVPPRDHVVVPFTITVPADAEPGDHAGAIVAVNRPTEEEGANLQYRVGTRIYLRVAGPVEAALQVDAVDGRHEPRWSPWASSPLDVTATLDNTGNVRLVPEARVDVAGIFGWWSESAALEGIDEILPDGAQAGGVRLDEVPPIGPLWVTVDVARTTSAGQDVSDLTVVTSHTVVVWAVPWLLVAVVALLIVAAVIAVVNLRRRRRARRLGELEASLAADADSEPQAPADGESPTGADPDVNSEQSVSSSR